MIRVGDEKFDPPPKPNIDFWPKKGVKKPKIIPKLKQVRFFSKKGGNLLKICQKLNHNRFGSNIQKLILFSGTKHQTNINAELNS